MKSGGAHFSHAHLYTNLSSPRFDLEKRLGPKVRDFPYMYTVVSRESPHLSFYCEIKMRHRFGWSRLGRDSKHRRDLLKNMAMSLIKHERIMTTLPKAKELRRTGDMVRGCALIRM